MLRGEGLSNRDRIRGCAAYDVVRNWVSPFRDRGRAQRRPFLLRQRNFSRVVEKSGWCTLGIGFCPLAFWLLNDVKFDLRKTLFGNS